MGEFLRPLADLDERLAPAGGYHLTLRAAEAVVGRLKPTGDGFDEAVALASILQSLEESSPYEGLLQAVADFEGSSGPSPSSPSTCG